MQIFAAAILAAVGSAIKARQDEHYGDYMSQEGAFDYSSYMTNFGPTYEGNVHEPAHDHHEVNVDDDHYHHGGDEHPHEFGTVHADAAYDHAHDDHNDSHDDQDHGSHDHDYHHADGHHDDGYQTPETVHYDDHHDEHEDDYHVGHVPGGDFDHQVHDFNEWEEIWDQKKYEWRLEQEAGLMVALEALREDLVELDHDIDDLFDCISDNDDGISDNDHGIAHNDSAISSNDEEISDQERRVSRGQKKCRRCQESLDYNKDVLVLHCQQFAFATDMIGACADILTCADTRLAYRADIFNGNHHNRVHEDIEYNRADNHDHERDHDHFHPEESSRGPIEVGHYTDADVHHAQTHGNGHY